MALRANRSPVLLSFILLSLGFCALKIFLDIDAHLRTVVGIFLYDFLIYGCLCLVVLHLAEHGCLLEHECGCVGGIAVRQADRFLEAVKCLGILLKVDIAVTLKALCPCADD